MKFSGGLKPFSNSMVRFAAREATTVTWLTQGGSLGTKDIGLAVSYPLSAKSNTTGSMSYSITAGSLPDGVTLDPDTGIVSGIPTSVGMYAFTVRATAGRVYKDQSFAITTNAVTLTWNTAAGTLGTINGGHALAAQTLSATTSNGEPVTYSLVSGSLPAGLSLSTSGAITGTPDNITVDSSFTVRATYAGILTADRTFGYSVLADSITWNTPAGALASLGGGQTANIVLSATCSAGDPITYTLVSGSLPGGASLVGNTISGKLLNVAGTSSFTIRASDGITHADRVFTITVAQDTITWATTGGALGSFGGGSAFSKTLSATSSAGNPVTYTIQTGSTPGLTITGSTLSGTVTNVSQSYSFTIRADDGTAFADLSFTLTTIADAVTWNSTTLPLISQNALYSQTLSATSSAGNPITYSIRSGALPTGVTLSNAGVVSGTYTGSTNATTSVTIRAATAATYTDQSFSITSHAAPIWTTAGGSLGTVSLGQQFSFTFSATDNVPIISYAVAPGSELPTTTTLTTNLGANTGTLSGFFNNPDGPLWPNSGSLGTYFRQDAVNLKLVANFQGNATSITSYSLVGDSTKVLPAGLTLYPNGVVTGSADLYSKDLLETPVTRYAAPMWTTNSNLGVIYIGNTISIPIQAIGQNGNTNTVTYAMSSQDILPFGIQLGLNGTISGSIDKTAVSQEAPVSAPAPIWNTPAGSLGSLTNSTLSPNLVLSSVTLSATPIFGNAITSYSLVGNVATRVANGVMTANGALPEGISLTQTGVLSGNTSLYAAFGDTPNAAALPSPTWVTSSGSLGNSNNGQTISLNLAVTPPANTNVTFFVSAGALPAGTTLTTTNSLTAAATITGTLDGNTTATSTTLSNARTFSFTVRALGNTGGFADQNFTYTINVT